MPGTAVALKFDAVAASGTDAPAAVCTAVAAPRPEGSGTASPTKNCVGSDAMLPVISSSDHSSGTNLVETASWLSSGCQPGARTTSRPLPSGASSNAGSPLSNFAITRDSGTVAG